MEYEVVDLGGVIPWLMKLDGSFLVDKSFLDVFLAEVIEKHT